MAISRRGFLGLLAAGGFTTAASAAKIPLPSSNITSRMTDREKLFLSYLPVLEANENKILHFYRDSKGRVTVGCGTNIAAHKALFAGLNIPVRYNGKVLSPKARDTFLNRVDRLPGAVLEKYEINEDDAVRLARQTINGFIDDLEKQFKSPADKRKKKVLFFGLPLCMQALALDVLYNVGRDGFKAYVKFDEALRKGDYETAVAESRVLTDKATKKYNVRREIRKKRFLEVCKIVWKSVGKKESLLDVLSQIVDSYDKQGNTNKDPAERRLNLCAETALATGEYYHFTQNWRHLSASQFEQKISRSMYDMNRMIKRENLVQIAKKEQKSIG